MELAIIRQEMFNKLNNIIRPRKRASEQNRANATTIIRVNINN